MGMSDDLGDLDPQTELHLNLSQLDRRDHKKPRVHWANSPLSKPAAASQAPAAGEHADRTAVRRIQFAPATSKDDSPSTAVRLPPCLHPILMRPV